MLTESVIAAALKLVRERLAERSAHSESSDGQLSAEIEKLGRQIKQLVSVASQMDEGDRPNELASELQNKTKRRRELQARLDAERIAPETIELQLKQLESEARCRLDRLSETLGRNVAQARRLLESLLAGPVRFTPTETPTGRRYLLEAETVVGGVFRIDSEPGGI